MNASKSRPFTRTRDKRPPTGRATPSPSFQSINCRLKSSFPMATCGLASSARHWTAGIAKSCPKNTSLQRGLSGSTGNNTVISPRQVPLTLLHKTSKIVPQVLGYGPASIKRKRGSDSGIWEKTLSKVYSDLSSSNPPPIRLAGMDCNGSSTMIRKLTFVLS